MKIEIDIDEHTMVSLFALCALGGLKYQNKDIRAGAQNLEEQLSKNLPKMNTSIFSRAAIAYGRGNWKDV